MLGVRATDLHRLHDVRFGRPPLPRARGQGGAPGPLGTKRPAIRVPRAAAGTTNAPVTKALIAINVALYLIGAVQGAGLNNPGGRIFAKLWLDAYDVHGGGWWRLITTAFLHADVLHIAFNMLALWWIGAPVEQYLGRARYVGLYLVAGLAGSAGALMQTPLVTGRGASGAIFGILGAMMILEYQLTGRLGGNAMTLIVINLVISFAFRRAISWGGHVGGLIGGILVTLAYARWGKGTRRTGSSATAGCSGSRSSRSRASRSPTGRCAATRSGSDATCGTSSGTWASRRASRRSARSRSTAVCSSCSTSPASASLRTWTRSTSSSCSPDATVPDRERKPLDGIAVFL